jgi:hypothetical protein
VGFGAAPADLREGSDGSGGSGGPAELNREQLERFPRGYRHLAYLQSQLGYPVR